MAQYSSSLVRTERDTALLWKKFIRMATLKFYDLTSQDLHSNLCKSAIGEEIQIFHICSVRFKIFELSDIRLLITLHARLVRDLNASGFISLRSLGNLKEISTAMLDSNIYCHIILNYIEYLINF